MRILGACIFSKFFGGKMEWVSIPAAEPRFEHGWSWMTTMVNYWLSKHGR